MSNIIPTVKCKQAKPPQETSMETRLPETQPSQQQQQQQQQQTQPSQQQQKQQQQQKREESKDDLVHFS